jgi:hypothetical protein
MFIAEFILCIALDCKVLREEYQTEFKEEMKCLRHAKAVAVSIQKEYDHLDLRAHTTGKKDFKYMRIACIPLNSLP